jgi:hypothetical protein
MLFNNPLINVLAAAISTGVILGVVNYFLAKKSGEKIVSLRYIVSFAIILLLYSGLFIYIQMSCDRKVTSYKEKIVRLKEEQKQRIREIEAAYAKELALMEWKNKVFTSDSEMRKSLSQAQIDYNLSPQEVSMWKGIAENNTLEKLIPKRNSNEVLSEYQGRLRSSLANVRSGQTLMTSDIRMLADNINTIRLIGKEYQKVLGSFKDLYEQINSNSQAELVMPKQKKFLFFPVKTKEYNKLLGEYYESKGNSKAMAEFSVKLKETIDKAEAEFAAINKRFEENLSFLESTSNSISYNSEKLEKLIEAAIDEANIINETDNKTNLKIKTNPKN